MLLVMLFILSYREGSNHRAWCGNPPHGRRTARFVGLIGQAAPNRKKMDGAVAKWNRELPRRRPTPAASEVRRRSSNCRSPTLRSTATASKHRLSIDRRSAGRPSRSSVGDACICVYYVVCVLVSWTFLSCRFSGRADNTAGTFVSVFNYCSGLQRNRSLDKAKLCRVASPPCVFCFDPFATYLTCRVTCNYENIPLWGGCI